MKKLTINVAPKNGKITAIDRKVTLKRYKMKHDNLFTLEKSILYFESDGINFPILSKYQK